MKKVVINKCYGGFGLSHEAVMRYAEIKGLNIVAVPSNISLFEHHYYMNEVADENYFSYSSIERDDPILVQVGEEKGEAANGRFSKLEIVEIPVDVQWEIAEYDGREWIAEAHRTWG